MLLRMDLLAQTPKANPTLATILEVERILQAESQSRAMPLSVSEIERRMEAKRTRRETVNAAINALVHYGVAAVGSKGVFYIRAPLHEVSRPTEALR